jgi:hypothetical protein
MNMPTFTDIKLDGKLYSVTDFHDGRPIVAVHFIASRSSGAQHASRRIHEGKTYQRVLAAVKGA